MTEQTWNKVKFLKQGVHTLLRRRGLFSRESYIVWGRGRAVFTLCSKLAFAIQSFM